MSILNERIQALLQNSGAAKVLATADKQGIPHIVSDPTISVNNEGKIIYLELIETSQSNVNLVNSIWFKRKVAIHLSKGEESYQIKGYPAYSVISGPVFEHYYKLSLERNPEFDLSTVWIIEPDEITDDTYAARKKKEREGHPLITHLDRLAK
ncbi:pyridoxamine 5'-phosphate oxidase family protein [Paenibacillus durus]|uniref:Pyridoxamine 5'-phosphate oxidase putative domain-containing protein n=1 Tax=Paenibacillus durus ATCC 35681 TaxID=1333534 RepID=A0A0F7FAP7_PAEDU|nr:pyridoxamine 5'-phosphate oxidase family protein [Paenibacillus durus]AKG35768.1 hypothetical protein VK70_15285 [Paenibacillus durus ATCC 35681]